MQAASQLGAQIISMPQRRAWWPPVRDKIEISMVVRAKLQALEVERALNGSRPSHILTLVWNEAPRIAVEIASRMDLPLACIIHDQQECWAVDARTRGIVLRRIRRVVDASSAIFAVSDSILSAYRVAPGRGHVLLPIPGDERIERPSSSRNRGGQFRVFFGGSLHPWQAPNFVALASALSRRGGKLVLLAPSDNVVWRKLSESHPQTERRDPPTDNEEVIHMLADEADACLVSYSMSCADQSWAAGSFPSKLVDFSRAGRLYS